nr:3210_t:CDS:2 [Entrophospora candida]
MDITVFLVLGIEKVQGSHGKNQAHHLDLIKINYTHSLLGAILWSILFGTWYRFFSKYTSSSPGVGRGGNNNKAAILVSLVVLSHWFEDLLAHNDDLLLFTFDNSQPKYGFALWDYPEFLHPLELFLFFLPYYYYLTSTTTIANDNQDFWARWGPAILSIDSIFTYLLINITNPPKNVNVMGIGMLLTYFKTIFLAHKVDKFRVSINNNIINVNDAAAGKDDNGTKKIE